MIGASGLLYVPEGFAKVNMAPAIPELEVSALQIPAAQYLRMSTEHQQFSLHNQSAAIAKYADGNGFVVIRTYEDAGKSGLALKNRTGLSTLLQDVLAGHQPYRAILVYDVSRWGRFQDTDEAAHYEFLCKKAGIPVVYCAEMFANDGGMPNLIMKALKRVMAGEYSRELSVKVFAGQKGIAERGFRLGGTAGYGFRRVLLSDEGEKKQILEPGEWKSVAGGRIKLVPGPPEEVACVRDIYDMLISDRKSIRQIVSELNARGIKSFGKAWTYGRVAEVLKNPKYGGIGLWGRTSQTLNSRQVHVPERNWVHSQSIVEPLVSESTFRAAQKALRSGTWFRSDEDLLDDLRSLCDSTGRLSQKIIAQSRKVPSVQCYVKRFGGLDKAYALIGYRRTRKHSATALRHRMRRLRDQVLVELFETFPDLTMTQKSSNQRPKLSLEGRRFTLLLCTFDTAVLGEPRWQMRPKPSESALPTLLSRCNPYNNGVQDFHLLPQIGTPRTRTLAESDPWLCGKRLKTLGNLRGALRRLPA